MSQCTTVLSTAVPQDLSSVHALLSSWAHVCHLGQVLHSSSLLCRLHLSTVCDSFPIIQFEETFKQFKSSVNVTSLALGHKRCKWPMTCTNTCLCNHRIFQRCAEKNVNNFSQFDSPDLSKWISVERLWTVVDIVWKISVWTNKV